MKRLRYDKVIVITVLMAMLSIVVGLAVLSKVKSQLIRISTESYKQQQSQLASQVADTLMNNFVNVQNQLRIMATMPEVKDTANVDQCNAKLNELLTVTQEQLGNLARTNPDGRFACSVNKAIIGQDSAQYGSYIHDLIKDPEHKPVLSRLTKPAGSDSLAAGLHVPVYDGEVFRGSLGGAIYFSKFQDIYLHSIKFGNNGFVVLLDDNGDILYHPSSDFSGKKLLDSSTLALFEPQENMLRLLEDIKAGKSGTFDYSVQGTRKLGLYKTFKIPDISRNWAVVVTIPTEDLEHVINQAGINNIVFVLVALFSLTTGMLTFVSLHNILKNREVQLMKDDFISITSHQLRTPATIVKQNLGLVKDGYAKNKRDIDRFINSAYESNENQLSIIENILSVSKLEAGHFDITKEPVNLQELINRIVASMKMSLAAKKHKLTVSMPAQPIRLQADSTKLSMAIENLLSNAIKYTSAKGKISVKVSRSKGMVKITVQDNGPGISGKDMPQLFHRFNRLNSAIASHVPGTGLGLYLTRKIIELHGGDITVDSRENKGSAFTIKLPLG